MDWLRSNRDLWEKSWVTKYSGKVSLTSARPTFELMQEAGLYAKTTFWEDAANGIEKLMLCVVAGTKPNQNGYKRAK